MKYKNIGQMFIEFLNIATAIYDTQYDVNDFTGEATLSAECNHNRKIKVVITMSEIDEDKMEDF